MTENSNNNLFNLINNNIVDELLEVNDPILEDSDSNFSLLDEILTDEEILKYLSLFNENNFQFVDDLDIENTIQPCSSINSNATTVSTQETIEFRESLLNSDVHDNNDNKMYSIFNKIENNTKTKLNSKISQLTSTNSTLNCKTKSGKLIQLNNEDNKMYNVQNNFLDNNCNQVTNNYFNQYNNQINQYQNYSTLYNNPQITYLNNNCNTFIGNNMNTTNLNTMNFCDSNNFTNFNNCTPNNYEFYSLSECRDTNCPYTYCSRFNPYFNGYFSGKNQFKSNPNFNNNFINDIATINMNLVDNQIVVNKPPDNVFETNNISVKKSRRKQCKSNMTEPNIICNESTGYTFFNLDDNLQKRKRGRKRKNEL